MLIKKVKDDENTLDLDLWYLRILNRGGNCGGAGSSCPESLKEALPMSALGS